MILIGGREGERSEESVPEISLRAGTIKSSNFLPQSKSGGKGGM
jgi:hypothetical protein